MSAYADTDRYIADYRTQMLEQRRARFTGDLGLTKQLEACGIGGWDTKGGWRQLRGNLNLALNSTNPRNKIGQAWGMGENKGTVDASLALSAEAKGATIGGTIQQTAFGISTGTPGRDTDVPSSTDQFAATGVVGQWKATGPSKARSTGSSDFQVSPASGMGPL